MVKYIDIADDIRSKIFDKKYTYGQKLPYEYVLCVAYHCNKETMKKALDILVKEGLIVRRRGAGTFVKDYDASSEDATQLKQSGLGLTRKLKEQLELEFEIRRNRQIYWDDVPMFCYFGEYELEIYPMNRQDVKEIDNIKELAAIDKGKKSWKKENAGRNGNNGRDVNGKTERNSGRKETQNFVSGTEKRNGRNYGNPDKSVEKKQGE